MNNNHQKPVTCSQKIFDHNMILICALLAFGEGTKPYRADEIKHKLEAESAKPGCPFFLIFNLGKQN